MYVSDVGFLSLFSTCYSEARDKFLIEAEAAGAVLTSCKHPEPGPDGEALHLDAARIGPREADRLFVLVSGTHGPEGFCGSACQTGWLRARARAPLPPGVAVLLLHAHNPFGFAWGVRQTHEKIDLNRNFVAHEDAPANPLCDRFYELLGAFPDQWSDEFFEHFRATKEAFCRERGREETEKWLGYGQYKVPHGLHFGGFEPSWSRETSSRLLREHAEKARHVVLIDIHTGLGRYGYGELLSVDPVDSAGFRRSRAVFGETVTSMPGGTSVATYSAGNVSEGVRRLLPQASVVAHALEFGTWEGPQLDPVKLKCQWMLAKDRLESGEGEAMRCAYRAIFYPENDDWKELVWMRAMMVCRQALAWLEDPEKRSRTGLPETRCINEKRMP